MLDDASARRAAYPIEDIFLARWSPRAFTAQPIPPDLLFRCFEAARWAPSAFNAQPWRFAYALREGPHWARFLDLLAPFNQAWAQNASALVFLASQTHRLDVKSGQHALSRSHAFDAGAAWGYFALQASMIGLHAHAMTGFDAERAKAALNAGADLHIDAAIAVGFIGDAGTLPPGLREREKPSAREPQESFVTEGGFRG